MILENGYSYCKYREGDGETVSIIVDIYCYMLLWFVMHVFVQCTVFMCVSNHIVVICRYDQSRFHQLLQLSYSQATDFTSAGLCSGNASQCWLFPHLVIVLLLLGLLVMFFAQRFKRWVEQNVLRFEFVCFLTCVLPMALTIIPSKLMWPNYTISWCLVMS